VSVALQELVRNFYPGATAALPFPKVFVAGSDALAVITPAVEARLAAIHADEALSRSTDGAF